MKANELRIGNYVLDAISNKIEKTDYLIIKIIGEEDGVYEPIPLTEEWLLEVGFISNPYDDRYEKGSIHVECDIRKGQTYLWIENMPHIKHVHQLQNLYFALTGEELTYGGNK